MKTKNGFLIDVVVPLAVISLAIVTLFVLVGVFVCEPKQSEGNPLAIEYEGEPIPTKDHDTDMMSGGSDPCTCYEDHWWDWDDNLPAYVSATQKGCQLQASNGDCKTTGLEEPHCLLVEKCWFGTQLYVRTNEPYTERNWRLYLGAGCIVDVDEVHFYKGYIGDDLYVYLDCNHWAEMSLECDGDPIWSAKFACCQCPAKGGPKECTAAQPE